MTKILFINPRTELLIHSVSIYPETDIRKLETLIAGIEKEQGPLDRVIISMKTVRVMELCDPIPKPQGPALSGKTGDRA